MKAQEIFTGHAQALLLDFELPQAFAGDMVVRRKPLFLARDLHAAKAIKLCSRLNEAHSTPCRDERLGILKATAKEFKLTLPFGLD